MIRILTRPIEIVCSAALLVTVAFLLAAAPEASQPTDAAGSAAVDQAKAEPAGDAEKRAARAESTRPASSTIPPIVYRPPKVGKPAHSVGGGSRGVGNTVPQLFVVAPEHVGQTVSARPSLYWYINPVPEASVAIEFTLLDEESVDPEVETRLARPGKPGLHRIALSDYGAELVAGTEYQWSVALVIDPDERSKDIVATAFIDRIEPDGELAARLERGTEGGAAVVYADEGIWYDALAALSEQIEEDPSNLLLLGQRADLLRQVGLDAAAAGSLE